MPIVVTATVGNIDFVGSNTNIRHFVVKMYNTNTQLKRKMFNVYIATASKIGQQYNAFYPNIRIL